MALEEDALADKFRDDLWLIDVLVANTNQITQQHDVIQNMLQEIESEDHKIIHQDKSYEVAEKYRKDNSKILQQLQSRVTGYGQLKQQLEVSLQEMIENNKSLE